MNMNVPTIEELVMGFRREILEAKEKLRSLERDQMLKIYPAQIDIWEKIGVLERFIHGREDLISMHKHLIRDERLKELGIDDEEI
jgi:hypothetical protein